ncbi:MAG: uracil phosphoribosyltransferase [Armatimonadetes bacterium]|nr:uracil phosphoribosyltransferase [Anaerolineae bacterium]
MSQLYISQHPLVKHKLSVLRDIGTDHRAFRELVRELAMMLCYEATQDINLMSYTVQTPLAPTEGYKADQIGLVPILRAGLGMVRGVMDVLPDVQVWHIGVYRDEKTLRPVEYYNRLPNTPSIQMCLVLDPMLATGGSATATVEILKRWGVQRIKFMGIIAAPEGVRRLSEAHPDVDIHVAALDSHLNEVGFIVPGLGDAGDRQFGT